MIHVVDEEVQRADPLLEALFDPVPFGRRHDPRYEIEGKDALSAGDVAVDVERNSHMQEDALGRLLPPQELAVHHRLDQLEQRPGGCSRLAPILEHLVEERAGLIVLEFHRDAILSVQMAEVSIDKNVVARGSRDAAIPPAGCATGAR